MKVTFKGVGIKDIANFHLSVNVVDYEFKRDLLIIGNKIFTVGERIKNVKFYIDDENYVVGTAIYKGRNKDGLPQFEADIYNVEIH